jgi:DNA-binding GntR family transcriptional regulator
LFQQVIENKDFKVTGNICYEEMLTILWIFVCNLHAICVYNKTMANINKAQLAYEKLREKLISRTLEPGQRLVETMWAQNLKVNRADVRQAFSRLLGEGLLRRGAKGGFFVREFMPAEMEQLTEVRLVLEIAAAKLAIDRATKQDIADLTKICDSMLHMAEHGYAMGVFEADLRFHEVLVRAAHNEKLEHIYRSSNLPLSMGVQRLNADKESLLKDAEDHNSIVKALEKKDVVSMVKLLSQGLPEAAKEIDNSERSILSALPYGVYHII